MSTLFKIKDHFKENKLYLNRTVSAVVIIFLLLTILLVRLIVLQIYQHDTYVTLARNNQVRVLPISPVRGLIYDRNGVLLAKNIPTFSLEITPSKVKVLNNSIENLSTLINISENEIKAFKKQLNYKGIHESIPIKTKLTPEEVAKFSVDRYLYPEAEVIGRLSRHYPHGQAFAHALGYLGPISEADLTTIDIAKYRGIHQIGKAGIEKSYENILHGVVGYEQVETDVRGRILRNLGTTKPTPGDNIYLSIDSELQITAHNLLKGKQGAIVALDVKTGGILALASSPSYDPNLFIQGIENDAYQKLQNNPNQPLFNRAIKGQYPPGSTVKPIIALQALEQKVISKNEKIHDPGYYKLNSEGRLFRDWKEKGHGLINLEQAIAESCSTFFYYLADKLGIEHIHNIYAKFGLGNPLGIDIQGESSGLIPSPEWKRKNKQAAWFPGETLITAIGQGYTLATPLQIAQIAAIIGNNGKKLQPTLVMATQANNKDKVMTSIKSLDQIKLKDERNWNIIRNSMEQVVKSPNGTAHRIYRGERLRIAGKTGTAQVFGLKQDEKYVSAEIDEHLRDHGWFMAFAPANDPQIALAVILEHNKGSSVAAAKLIDVYQKKKKHISPTPEGK